MSCKCIQKLDAELERIGEPMRVDAALTIDFKRGTTAEYMQIAMVRSDRKRKNLPKMICTFCPVCGKKYKSPNTRPAVKNGKRT